MADKGEREPGIAWCCTPLPQAAAGFATSAGMLAVDSVFAGVADREMLETCRDAGGAFAFPTCPAGGG